MTAAARWTSDTPDLLTAEKWDRRSRAWVHLVAEALPDGRWDWAAWSGDNTGRSVHGVGQDRSAALCLAEHAAAAIGRVRVLATG